MIRNLKRRKRFRARQLNSVATLLRRMIVYPAGFYPDPSQFDICYYSLGWNAMRENMRIALKAHSKFVDNSNLIETRFNLNKNRYEFQPGDINIYKVKQIARSLT